MNQETRQDIFTMAAALARAISSTLGRVVGRGRSPNKYQPSGEDRPQWASVAGVGLCAVAHCSLPAVGCPYVQHASQDSGNLYSLEVLQAWGSCTCIRGVAKLPGVITHGLLQWGR